MAHLDELGKRNSMEEVIQNNSLENYCIFNDPSAAEMQKDFLSRLIREIIPAEPGKGFRSPSIGIRATVIKRVTCK